MLGENGQKVFDARYAARDDEGNICETFEEAVGRIACAAAMAEDGSELQDKWCRKFQEAIGNLLFVPSTPIWANMGKHDRPNQPGACFVLPVEDTLDSMYQTLKNTATVFKSGGGVGYNFSAIRPRGSLVRSTKGKASGVVELIKLYDASSSMVMQGGVRRGASMGILNVDHPEVLDFIECKRDGSITNFNLSVGITDAFMQSVTNDGMWCFDFEKWPTAANHYRIRIPARELWRLIAEAAHACGDPGLIFVDRLQAKNPVPSAPINATNPCWDGDTEVLTVDGWATFERLSLTGEADVITVNSNGCYSIKTMRDIRRTADRTPVVRLKLFGGGYADCTSNHVLYRPDMSKVQVRDLRRFDVLGSIGGGSVSVEEVSPLGMPAAVYNGTVDETHRYFVRMGNIAVLSANCGEEPLSANESCLLGSVNLAKMVKGGEVDWGLIDSTVQTGIRFLDNMIDVADYPLSQIEEATKATRKVGLGYTGLADMLIQLGVAYDSEEGRETAGLVASAVYSSACACSRKLADEKGCFPLWHESIYHPNDKRRNATVMTVAPTGSVTAMAGCEGYGIEPIFAVAYTKETKVAGNFEVFSPLFLGACREANEQHRCNISKETLSEVARRGSCQGASGIPKVIQILFKGAQEIAPEDHIKMQATIQKYVDSAVSKSVNLPNSATVDDVMQTYRMAYDLNLKGITVFRDGCKKGVITVGEKQVKNGSKSGDGQNEPTLQRGEIISRPRLTAGVTHRLDTGCGKLYLTVNHHPETGEILETFITTGSDGGCLIYTEATSRMISLAVRGGIPIEQIIEQLASTHACPAYQMARGRGKELSPGKSCASAIARKLREILATSKGRDEKESDASAVGDDVICEVCGAKMHRAEGCFVCRECGASRC